MAYQPVPNVDLCLVADVVSFLGGNAPATTDEIQREITAYSQLAASYCGRKFMLASYVEVRNGTGTGTIMPKQVPITAVSALTVDGVVMRPVSSPGKNDGYSFNETAVYLGNCARFPRGTQNVVIEYTAGFVDLSNPSLTTIPYDLRNSIVVAVSDLFKKRQNIGIQSKTIAGETIVYGGLNVPSSVALVWDQYQRAAYGY